MCEYSKTTRTPGVPTGSKAVAQIALGTSNTFVWGILLWTLQRDRKTDLFADPRLRDTHQIQRTARKIPTHENDHQESPR